jgi:osmotically-inducible protein OsmY
MNELQVANDTTIVRSDKDIQGEVGEAIGVLGDENFENLSIDVHGGVVTLFGTADRSSTRNLAVDIASRVAGVSEVADHLDYALDDDHLRPVPNHAGLEGPDHDPCAVGALVKEA